MGKIFFKGILETMQNYITDAVNSLLNFLMNSTFYVKENILTMPGVSDKYQASVQIARSFVYIFLLYSIFCLYQSSSEQYSAKLKRSIYDLVGALFFITFGNVILTKLNEGANLFTQMWLPDKAGGGDVGAVLFTSLGVAAADATLLSTLGSVLLGVLVAAVVLILLLMLTHSIIHGLLVILTILFPLVAASLPSKFGKQLFEKVAVLYGGLLAIAPIQALSLSLTIDMLSGKLDLSNIMVGVGMLILTALVIPGGLFYVVAIASNPKIID